MNELRIVSMDKILRFENTLIIIKNRMLCFVLINSVLLNLSCVWVKQTNKTTTKLLLQQRFPSGC